MEIDKKYFDLLNTLVYDKRTKMYGMISGVLIRSYLGCYGIHYQVFYNRLYTDVILFVEDIEQGNVVFVLPFTLHGSQKDIFDKMAQDHEIKIKEFFGEKFREDMIIRISEEARQEEIRKWKELSRPLEDWSQISGSHCEN